MHTHYEKESLNNNGQQFYQYQQYQQLLLTLTHWTVQKKTTIYTIYICMVHMHAFQIDTSNYYFITFVNINKFLLKIVMWLITLDRQTFLEVFLSEFARLTCTHWYYSDFFPLGQLLRVNIEYMSSGVWHFFPLGQLLRVNIRVHEQWSMTCSITICEKLFTLNKHSIFHRLFDSQNSSYVIKCPDLKHTIK